MQKVGYNVVRQTQFRGDFLDLPYTWVGPYGRLITQFKTFAFNQARLFNKMVIQEAKQGNFRPAIYFFTVYPAVGAGYDAVVNQLLLGKDPPKDLLERYFRGLFTIGGLGMIDSMLTASLYGRAGLEQSLY